MENLQACSPKVIPEACITNGALRMRASRQRRRNGLRCLILDIKDSEIGGLIDLGLLKPGDQDDRFAIAQAVYAFLDAALGGAHR